MMRWNAPLVAAITVMLVACGGGSDDKGPTPPETGVESVVAAADRADGNEDGVVSKCAVCSLKMEGSPDYASQYAGATFHFCSADCKATFDKDPQVILARLPK